MASLLHKQSCECTKSELDLFSVPPTQTSIEHGHWIEYYPLAAGTEYGPIEFNILGSGEEYMDLGNTALYLRAKIVKSDGSDLTADDQVGPSNLFLHSLFSQVDVALNETLVSPSTNTYPYRAYLETLLSYGDEAKTSQLTSELWVKDEPGKLDDATNTGLVERRSYTDTSKVVELFGRLHSDIFMQDRYLPNGVNVKIRLVRSKDAFALLCFDDNPTYRVKIEDAKLYVRKVKLAPSVHLGLIKALEKGTLKYPIRRVECKILSVPSRSMTFNKDSVISGQLPKRVVIGLVDNDAYNGIYGKNPYNFKHNKLNFLAVYLDGQQIPAKPLQPNFEEDMYIRSYLTLYQGTGMYGDDAGNTISRKEYKHGYTLYAFNLTPDLAEGLGHLNLIKHGDLRLVMHFAETLPETVNVVVYAEFDNIVEIDRNRNILFDYTA